MVYHGVPMTTLPVWYDQHHNAKRVEHRGYGLTLPFYVFTGDDLLAAITEVIHNKTYKDNIQRCSRISRDMPTAKEKLAVFWTI